jgi:hypothetical protein
MLALTSPVINVGSRADVGAPSVMACKALAPGIFQEARVSAEMLVPGKLLVQVYLVSAV